MIKNKKLLTYRIFLSFIGLIGILLQILGDGFGKILYYTVISNIISVIFLIYIIKVEIKDKSINKFNNLIRVKGGVTMMITLTCVVYHILLAPYEKAHEYWNIRNFIVHYIVPIGIILDTIIFDKRNVYKIFDPLYWTIVPIMYSFFAIINGLIIKIPIPKSKHSPFPYFFINVSKYGWIQVLKNIGMIAISYIILSYTLVVLKKYIGRNRKNKMSDE